MNRPNTTMPGDHDPSYTETDILLSRLVDGEASAEDRHQFDEMAAADPMIWRRLAMHQQDHILLAGKVDSATGGADAVELRHPWVAPRRLTGILAYSGWAALIILALSWIVVMRSSMQLGDLNGTNARAAQYSPEQAFKEYRQAPYVLDEMPAEVLDVADVGDGRVAVRFVRQIEEVVYLDPDRALPVDEDGNLITDPAVLRAVEAHRRLD
jgi:hypothetical protein